MQGALVARIHDPWPRPGELVWAAVALLAAVIVDYALGESFVAVLSLPLFVMAIRFFELARFELVHRSGWLLVYTVWCVFGVAVNAPWRGPWDLSLPPGGLLIVASVLSVALFWQQRQHQLAMRRTGAQRADQHGEDWALGGCLAAIFVFLVLSALGTIDAGISIWSRAIAVLSLPLLWLQLSRHPWFPVLVWFWWTGRMVLLIAESGNEHERDIQTIYWAIFSLLLGFYLLLAKRVRRTFAASVAA